MEPHPQASEEYVLKCNLGTQGPTEDSLKVVTGHCQAWHQELIKALVLCPGLGNMEVASSLFLPR